MRENKRKIKGVSTRLGIMLTSTMLATSPITAYADELENNNQAISNETRENTDLEKYFNCEIPMDENYQVTTDSNIYKILSFYEGQPEAINGQYAIELDSYGNLVVGSGLTVIYQSFLLEYLSDYGSTAEEIDSNIKALMSSGISVYIPEYIINQGFLNKIQECRDFSINIAKSYNINLSSSQIDVFTETIYRYGQGSVKSIFNQLAEGKKLEDIYITLERTMSKTDWDSANLKNYVVINSEQDGYVNYTIYIKPFNALGMKATIENLSSVDIATSLKGAESDQLEGDWRRCLFRQVGIENDICVLIINSSGTCRYWENGEEKEINIVDYLNNMKQNSIENSEYSTYLDNQNVQEISLNDNSYLQTDEILESSTEDNYIETEGVLETSIEDNYTEVEEVLETGIEAEEGLETDIENNNGIEVEQEIESDSENINEHINNNNNQITNTTETSLVPLKKDTWYQKIIQSIKNIGIISASLYVSSNLIKNNRKKIRKMKRKAKRKIANFLDNVIEYRDEKRKRKIRNRRRTNRKNNNIKKSNIQKNNTQRQDDTAKPQEGYKGLSKERRAELFAELRRQAEQTSGNNYDDTYRQQSKQTYRKRPNKEYDDIDRVR